MQYVIQTASCFEDKFREVMGAKHKAEVKKEITAKRKAITKTKKRIEELDKLFTSIYEDKVNGILFETRFKQMSANYEREQEELRKSVIALTTELEHQQEQSDNIERFI